MPSLSPDGACLCGLFARDGIGGHIGEGHEMKFATIGLAAAILASAGLSGASAQTMSYADAGALLAANCGKDIVKYCPKVNLGGGQLKDCLVQYEPKLNPQCIIDYKMAIASLAKRNAAQLAAPKACRNAAANYCQGTAPGDANYLDCLLAASKVVGAACNQALTDAGWR